MKPLDAEVRILPNQKELGAVIRNMQKTGLAYPLKQIAYFFLDHPEACMLRVTPTKGADVSFYQCKACGFVACSEADMISHVLNVHLSDYYDSEEIECDPPKGTFSCVARCGLSGELLGPPNLHGYDAKVREMVRTRYPDMSEEAYRARIEMVRDADMVEEWRKSCTKKTVYRRKVVKSAAAPEGAENEAQTEVPAVEREAAELEFRRTIAPGLIANPKNVELTAETALKCPDRAFLLACRDALAREKNYPSSLFFALRGAFHYRKLTFFRANDPRGQEFVSSAKPTALDLEHAIPDLVEIVKYVEANPDVTQAAVVSALAAGDQAKASSIKANLAWLVEKGNLVGYFNGQLALPAENPRFRNIQRKPAKEAKPAAPAPAEPAPAPAEPAPAPAEPAPVEPATDEPAPAPAEPAPAAPAPAEPAPASAEPAPQE